VVILNIAERNLSQLDSELHKLELSVGSSPLEKRVVCCVGKEFCKYGLVDTKGKWREIVENIRLDLPFDEDIKIHISGCPHGCAEHLVADIGLQGCLCKLNGKDVEAFDIKVGGGLGKEAMFARSIESKVPIDITKMKIEKLLNTYIQNRADGENFKDFCARHTQQQLAEFVKVDRVPR
jgi:sulfite reductase beta subunit-like hemoprotein